MLKVNMNLISVAKAKEINEEVRGKGIPVNDRVLIVSPEIGNDTKTKGGLFIPGDADKETVPRKGVVVQLPANFQEREEEYPGLQVGSVVNYGIYAGKELDIVDIPDQVTTILSLNEVIYIETNK